MSGGGLPSIALANALHAADDGNILILSVDALCSVQRYNKCIFMAPPWPEIYVTDAERRHGFEAATAEYQRLMQTLPTLGYDVISLPKTSPPSARADFVLASLAGDARPEA